MSIQKQLLEDIYSTYNIIESNRKFILETSQFLKLVDTNYSNVNYDNDGTQSDLVNKPLLDDIQKAASSVGIVATITTAKTGHNQNVKDSNRISRHMNGTGVDLAILNGIRSDGATGPNNGNAQFRELGNKLKDALVSMGYVWNTEVGNDKAVMWQTNTGGNHFSHLHVSNRSGVSSESPTTSGSTSGSTSQTSTSTPSFNLKSGGGAAEFAKNIGGQILNVMGIKESAEIRKFGSNVQSKGGRIIIPKNDNTKIKAPLSGRITNILSNKSCINQVVIEVSSRDFTGYLEYCGITQPSVQIGDKVNVGDLLGTTKSNVTVTFYTENKKVKPITDTEPKKNATGLSSLFLTKPSENNPNKKTDSTKTEKRSSGNDRDKKPEKPINAKDEYSKMLIQTYRKFKNPFKLEENINRIKGLL